MTHNENGIDDSLAVTKYHKFHDQTENNCLLSAVMAVFRMHQEFFCLLFLLAAAKSALSYEQSKYRILLACLTQCGVF